MAKTKPSSLDKIIAHNHAISVMLQENEELYKNLASEKVDVPKDKELIKFPVGRIETLKTFNKRYHLPEILKREITVTNTGYCLQACELYKYLIEHFGFYGSIEKMLYRQWIVCLGSIIEAMICESAQLLGIDEVNFRKIMCNTNYPDIVCLLHESKSRIHRIYDLRNHVHLIPELNKADDSKKLEITRADVDEAQQALDELAELLYKKAVPNYNK